MKLVATKKGEQNRAIVDPWTVVHFATGLAAGLVDMPRGWALSAAAAYELVEQYAERQDWGQDLFETSRAECIPNAVVDLAVFAAGHYLGELWNSTPRR
jgi:hypothetical protein